MSGNEVARLLQRVLVALGNLKLLVDADEHNIEKRYALLIHDGLVTTVFVQNESINSALVSIWRTMRDCKIARCEMR